MARRLHEVVAHGVLSIEEDQGEILDIFNRDYEKAIETSLASMASELLDRFPVKRFIEVDEGR